MGTCRDHVRMIIKYYNMGSASPLLSILDNHGDMRASLMSG